MKSKLLVLLSSLFLFSCNNLELEGTKEVTVLYKETNEPAVNFPLHYTIIMRPYFIVGQIAHSKAYVTDKNGHVLIPENKGMHAHVASDYIVDDKTYSLDSDIIYLIDRDKYKYMKQILEDNTLEEEL